MLNGGILGNFVGNCPGKTRVSCKRTHQDGSSLHEDAGRMNSLRKGEHDAALAMFAFWTRLPIGRVR